MTRAADHLIVSLHHRPPRHGSPDTHAMRLAQMLPALEAAGAACEPAARPVPAGAPGPAAAASDGASAQARRRFLTSREELLRSAMTRLPTTATGPRGDRRGAVAGAARSAGRRGQRPRRPGRRLAGRRSGATLGSTVHRALEILDLAGRPTRRSITPSRRRARNSANGRLATEVRSRVQAALTAPSSSSPSHPALEGGPHRRSNSAAASLRDSSTSSSKPTKACSSWTTKPIPPARPPSKAKTQHYAPQIRAYAQALGLATGLRIAPPQLLFCRPTGATCRRRVTTAFTFPPTPPSARHGTVLRR